MQSSVAQAIAFVEERLAGEEAKETRPLRGPYLARLELIRRLRGRGCPAERQLGGSCHSPATVLAARAYPARIRPADVLCHIAHR